MTTPGSFGNQMRTLMNPCAIRRNCTPRKVFETGLPTYVFDEHSALVQVPDVKHVDEAVLVARVGLYPAERIGPRLHLSVISKNGSAGEALGFPVRSSIDALLVFRISDHLYPESISVYRVNHPVRYYLLLTLNSLFRGLPNSGWAAANLAELAWHVGNMVKFSSIVNKIQSRT